MLKKYFLFLAILFIEVKCVEWQKNAIFYSIKMENFKKSNDLSKLKDFGVKSLILKDVVKGECFDDESKALMIDEMIVSTHELDIKIVIDLQYFLTIENKFFSSSSKETSPKSENIDLNLHYQNTINELKVVMTHWISRGVDGFKVDFESIAEDNDNRQLLNIFIGDLEKFLKEWSEHENKIFLIETSDNFSMAQTPVKNSSFVTFFLDRQTKYENDESSNNAWILQILLPGLVVLDDSINAEEYLSFLKLRNHQTFQTGSVETINLRDDVLVLKRELKGYETFIIFINLGEENVEIDWQEITGDSKNKKVAATSPGSFYQIGWEHFEEIRNVI